LFHFVEFLTTSWKDGMALCALVHSTTSAIDYHDLQEVRCYI
jgi:hypothetical protein